MAARGPQNGRHGLEKGVPQVNGRFQQLLQSRFFDWSTPSMRKGCDGEKTKRKKIIEIVATINVGRRLPNGDR